MRTVHVLGWCALLSTACGSSSPSSSGGARGGDSGIGSDSTTGDDTVADGGTTETSSPQVEGGSSGGSSGGGSESGAPGGDAGGGCTACTKPDGSTSTGARGRPTVVNNTLVSDQGTLLRGSALWFVPEDPSQYNWAVSTSDNPDQDDCTTKSCGNPWPIFGQYHLNTVRLAVEYGPKAGNDLTKTEADIASAVAQATAHGMYAVIDLHWSSGEYDLPSAKTFWSAIAPLYKDNTNVIFELLNEPVSWRPMDYTTQNVQDEETLYNIVHTAAPDTPVIMMTFAIPMNTAASNTTPTMADVSKKLTGIDWTKTVVGFHGYWVNYDTGESQLQASFPAMNTEFASPCNQAGDENAGIMQDYCVYDVTKPTQVDTYQSQVMEELKLSWLCWDCNSEPGSDSRLASLQQAAMKNGWWWPADE